ncbi:signal peptidase I [Candidatus Desantisbacteria bacterium]|nr:signal peptidase I [Candidatus Desantisbacteria bacterium]
MTNKLAWIKNDKNKEILEFIKSIVIALIIALTLRSSVIEANFIFSGSMTPTLLAGDYVLVNKMAYNLRIPFSSYDIINFKLPKRGDIVTFIYPQDNSKIFVKRVIGLPGDIIEIKNQELYINNEKIKRISTRDYDTLYSGYNEYIESKPHSIIHRKAQSIYGDFGPIVIPDNSYFVLGDNRDNSADSRFWGFVPGKNILGRALIIYFSNSETMNWKSPSPFDWIKGIRLKRFGSILLNS